MFPVFLKNAEGSISFSDTKAARQVKVDDRCWEKPKEYDAVRIAAYQQCREEGGDVKKAKQWMCFLTIQWGTLPGVDQGWLSKIFSSIMPPEVLSLSSTK